MKQGISEGVKDFLSRLVKVASMKNVPEKVLLSVAMNGLRHDLKRSHKIKKQWNI